MESYYYLCFLLWLVVALITIHFLLQSLQSRRGSNPRKLPPGPFPLPIIGNLLHIGKHPHKSVTELANTYGPVMTLRLGQVTTVVVSSAAIAKEVLQKQDVSFSNRFLADASRTLNYHELAMGYLPPSARWRNLRKICNSKIFSTSRLDGTQHVRHKKVGELLSYIQTCSRAGLAVDIGQAAFSAIINELSTIIFSMDFVSIGSETASEFKEHVHGEMEELGRPNLSDYFPLLRRLDVQGVRKRMEVHLRRMTGLLTTLIDQRLLHKRHGLDEGSDVLDELLDISQESGQEFNRSQLIVLLSDLFVAGTDTTSTILEWAMAEVLRNPDKFKKAQEELNQVIGRGNPLREGDIARLPYLQSVVKETLRLHPPGPFLLPRKVDMDVELGGYLIPKNARVLVNAWAIGRDPNNWENSLAFEPERFIGSGIDVKGQDFELIPFGAGRRICPGLPLAMRMVTLILGSLIHTFNWRFENGTEAGSMDMDDKFGLTLQKAEPLRVIPIPVQ